MYEPLPELYSSQENYLKVLVASPWLSFSISDQPSPPNSHRERAVENSHLQNEETTKITPNGRRKDGPLFDVREHLKTT